jgi:uracil-DNA glycosylase family 4
MKNLIKEIKACEKCEISAQTKNKSIGRGSFSPTFLFVGLNPGKQENESGRPFCGPSGRLLDQWVEYLGISPKDYSVVNIVKCYTSNESELKGDEIGKCLPFLQEQIKILKPKYIILLGAKPAQTILETKIGITKLQGKIFRERNDIDEKVDDTYFIPLTHPSYWLRNGGKGWEPMLENFKLFINGSSTSEEPSDINGLREITPLTFKKVVEKVDEKVVEYQEQDYVPLHTHTTYSIADGVAKLDELAKRAREMGFKSLAITDHGTIGGWVEFQKSCKDEGIKPILGIEFYVAKDYKNKDSERMHVVALAKNEKGINNIFKLNNKAQSEGFYYKARILLEDLLKYNDGLVILSACTLGIVAKPIVDGNKIEGEINLEQLKEKFGDDFYLELQPHNFDGQKLANPALIALAEKHNIKTVITTDIHYIKAQNKKTHDALKAIAYRKKMGEAGFSIDTNYLMSTEELRDESLALNIPENIIEKSFSNTKEVADKCNTELKRYENALPKFEG